jgi:hypothetical protein
MPIMFQIASAINDVINSILAPCTTCAIEPFRSVAENARYHELRTPNLSNLRRSFVPLCHCNELSNLNDESGVPSVEFCEFPFKILSEPEHLNPISCKGVLCSLYEGPRFCSCGA